MLISKFIVKMINDEITLFGRINWQTYGLRTITVREAITIIKDGIYFIDDTARSGMEGTLKEVTGQIQALSLGADIQTAKAQFLPAVSFNGVYNNGIVKYSNYTALDFDHIQSEQEFNNLKQRLMATPCVAYVYRTPSGRGLKALVLHDNTEAEKHTNLYLQLMKMFKTPELSPDPKCKDLNRRNYLCYDPDVWINPQPVPFHFTYDESLNIQPVCTKTLTTTGTQRRGTISDASVMNLLKSRCKRFHPEYLVEGRRRDGVYWFGTQTSKAGVDYQYGLDFVNELFHSNEITLTAGGVFTEDEVSENFANGYDAETYDENYRNNFILKRNH